MADVLLDIFVNVTERKFVRGITDATGVVFLPFVVGDKYPLAVRLLARSSYAAGRDPFTVIAPTTSLKVTIGPRAGGAAVAETTSFTTGNNSFLGTLDLSTSEYSAAVAAGTTLDLSISVLESSNYKTVARQTLVQGLGAISSPTLTPLAGGTALSREEAAQLYLTRAGVAGEVKRWVSDDGAKSALEYLHNDGTWHCDPES